MKTKFLIASLVIANCAFAQQWHLASVTAGDPIVAISIYKSDPDTIYALGAKAGLWISTDGGAQWDTVLVNGTSLVSTGPPDEGLLKTDPYSSQILYAYIPEFQSALLLKSTDGGSTWKVSGVAGGGDTPYSLVLEIDPSNNRILYAGGTRGAIVRSTDQGETWDSIPEPAAAYYSNALLTSLAIAASSDSVIYAGYDEGIFKSTDKGSTWATLDLGFGIHSQVLLSVDPRSLDTVYAAVFPSSSSPSYSGGVYKSIDGGQTWKEADSGLTEHDRSIMSITINPKNPDQLFIGLNKSSGHGTLFFESTDAGDHWTTFADGLPDSGSVNCIELDTANNKMYCGFNGGSQNGGGVYIRDIVTGIEGSETMPHNFHLSQNYPNPFNPSTIVEYEIPVRSFARLTVYDILGREVKTLVEGYKEPGSYRVILDGQNLASGVYFYRLVANRETLTKKMVLMR